MPQLFKATIGGEGASSEDRGPFIAVPPPIIEALGRGRRPLARILESLRKSG
jgi:hypothetical protein